MSLSRLSLSLLLVALALPLSAADERLPATFGLDVSDAIIRAGEAVVEAYREETVIFDSMASEADERRYKSKYERAKKMRIRNEERLQGLAEREITKAERRLEALENEAVRLAGELETARDQQAERLETEREETLDEVEAIREYLAILEGKLWPKDGQIEASSPYALEGLNAGRHVFDPLEGDPAAIADREADYHFVIFWSTRNQASVKLLAEANSAAARLQRKGVEFLAINVGDSEEQIKDVIGARRWYLKFGKSGGKKPMYRELHVVLLPTTYFINREHTVHRVFVGAWSSQGREFQKLAEDVIAADEKRR